MKFIQTYNLNIDFQEKHLKKHLIFRKKNGNTEFCHSAGAIRNDGRRCLISSVRRFFFLEFILFFYMKVFVCLCFQNVQIILIHLFQRFNWLTYSILPFTNVPTFLNPKTTYFFFFSLELFRKGFRVSL